MNLADLLVLYSPEHGVNWIAVVAALCSFVASTGLATALTVKFVRLLLRLLNKIPFFRDSDVDEALAERVIHALEVETAASNQAAQDIREKYLLQIAKASREGDHEKVVALSKEMRSELESLTRNLADDFMENAEADLRSFLTQRYGDKAKAVSWITRRVKALVENLKHKDGKSTSSVILDHASTALGDLGKDLSAEKVD